MVALTLAGRWLLGVVFVVAGIVKVATADREPLSTTIERYGVVPQAMNRPAAFLLPWGELLLGVLLASGVAVVVVSASAALLLATFACAVGWHRMHGERFACGCGGGGTISWALAVRDLCLCAVAIAVCVTPDAGMAAWPGWGERTASASLQTLAPIPLIVIMAFVVLRLGRTVRQSTRLGLVHKTTEVGA